MSMDKVSFQNGFICGMATKGLVRSGSMYEPDISNDSGIYDYFYIDFRRSVDDFSMGMWDESIIVYDSVALEVTGVEQVSVGVYKVYCNIADKIHGFTVINKVTSRLCFADGTKIPPFSVHAFVAGEDRYLDAAYMYGVVKNTRKLLSMPTKDNTQTETAALLLRSVLVVGSEYETITNACASILGYVGSVTELAEVSLT